MIPDQKLHLLVLSLLLCLGTSSFLFSKPHDDTGSNICIYSADPSKYPPNCFVCLNAVYPNSLQACVNSTTMPSNVSYDQAKCIEKNCAINYPEGKKPEFSLHDTLEPWLEVLQKLSKISKRSIDDDSILSMSNNLILPPRPSYNRVNITQQVNTYASDMGKEEEDEYELY